MVFGIRKFIVETIKVRRRKRENGECDCKVSQNREQLLLEHIKNTGEYTKFAAEAGLKYTGKYVCPYSAKSVLFLHRLKTLSGVERR